MNSLKQIEEKLVSEGKLTGNWELIKLTTGGGTSPLGTILTLHMQQGKAVNINGFLVNAETWIMVGVESLEERYAREGGVDAVGYVNWEPSANGQSPNRIYSYSAQSGDWAVLRTGSETINPSRTAAQVASDYLLQLEREITGQGEE